MVRGMASKGSTRHVLIHKKSFNTFFCTKLKIWCSLVYSTPPPPTPVPLRGLCLGLTEALIPRLIVPTLQ